MFHFVPVYLQKNATFMILDSLLLKRLSDEVRGLLLHLYPRVISHERRPHTRSKVFEKLVLYEWNIKPCCHCWFASLWGDAVLVLSHLSHDDARHSRSPSGVDGSKWCCVAGCVTPLTSLSSSLLLWRWQVAVIVYSFRRKKSLAFFVKASGWHIK